jgi:hypothetical protein
MSDNIWFDGPDALHYERERIRKALSVLLGIGKITMICGSGTRVFIEFEKEPDSAEQLPPGRDS